MSFQKSVIGADRPVKILALVVQLPSASHCGYKYLL